MLNCENLRSVSGFQMHAETKPVCRLWIFLLVPIADQLEGFLQNRSRPGAVGFADQAFALHLIEHGSGTAIADAQTALQD